MRILVATSKSQGQRSDDFNWLAEGELVYIGVECADFYGECGCRRSFAGWDSQAGTTTALVVETPMTETEYRERLGQAIRSAGWREPDALAKKLASQLLGEADRFPLGTVVEWRGEVIERGKK